MTVLWTFRSLARHPIRNGLVVLGIAVAAALLLDMTLLAGGMERSFREMLLSRGFQVRLSPKGTLPFDTEATISRVTPLLDSLRADPGISLAGPVVGSSIYLRLRDSLVTFVAYGFDPTAQGIYQLDRGMDLGPGDTTGFVASPAAVARANWQIGDTATWLGRLDPQTAVAHAERRVVLRAVVSFLYDAKGQRSIGANYQVVQRLGRFGPEDAASMVMVKVREGHDVEAVAARIGAVHPNIQVNSVAALVAQFRTRLAYFQQLSLILATISLVVGILLVGTILTITVNERIGEVAVLRAIGFRRARIVRMVMIEGALLTAVGSLLGVGLGLLTARYLDAILTSFPGLPARISFFVPEPVAITRAAITMFIAGVVAAAYPAWLAARSPIALTLRSNAE